MIRNVGRTKPYELQHVLGGVLDANIPASVFDTTLVEHVSVT